MGILNRKDNERALPTHVAIIMDGNGRWAKKRGLPRTAGHVAGADTLVKIARYAFDRGIKVLSVYAFSTENWSRPKDEVDNLMRLAMENYGASGIPQASPEGCCHGNRHTDLKYMG